MIIFVLGKSGSGKSTVAKLVNEIDGRFVVQDLDKTVHKLYENPAFKKEIINHFGIDVLDHNLNIDRNKIRGIVFNSPEELNHIENLVLKHMNHYVEDLIKKHKHIVFDGINCHKLRCFELTGLKILVEADYDNRKTRILLRDNITENNFNIRDKNSKEYSCKFDFKIINDGSYDKLYREVKKIYEKSIVSG